MTSAELNEKLLHASSTGKFDAAKALLALGANVNYCEQFGWNALLSAARAGHTQVSVLLLENGAVVDHSLNNNGVTALILAAQNGHADTVEALLANGASINQRVNIQHYKGFTALMFAKRNGHRNVVDLLLSRGALELAGENQVLRRLHSTHFAQQTTKTATTTTTIATFNDEFRMPRLRGFTFAPSEPHSCARRDVEDRQTFHKVQRFIKNAAELDRVRGKRPLADPDFFRAIRCEQVAVVQRMIDGGADVTQSDRDGTTPLMIAAELGRGDVAKLLIDNGADVNRSCNCRDPALIQATRSGHTKVAKLLLENGAKVNQCSLGHSTRTALSAAVEYETRRLEKFMEAHSRAQVRPTDRCRHVPLQFGSELKRPCRLIDDAEVPLHIKYAETWATICGERSALVELLLANGALFMPDGLSRAVNSELMIAVSGGHAGVAKALLENGAAIDHTALMVAAKNGYEHATKVLLDHGAQINLINGVDHGTALTRAVEERHKGIVKLLLEKGADCSLGLTRTGHSALLFAAHEEIGLVELLLGSGADVNQVADDGSTALMIAAGIAWVPTVKLLLANGATALLNQAANCGSTALSIAVGCDAIGVVELLLRAGADVNQVNQRDGSTALTIAAKTGCAPMIKLLLAYGADVDRQDTVRNETALCLVWQKRNLFDQKKEVSVDLLLSASISRSKRTENEACWNSMERLGEGLVIRDALPPRTILSTQDFVFLLSTVRSLAKSRVVFGDEHLRLLKQTSNAELMQSCATITRIVIVELCLLFVGVVPPYVMLEIIEQLDESIAASPHQTKMDIILSVYKSARSVALVAVFGNA